MKTIKTLFISVFRLFYFLPVLALIILLVLLFGHPILGPALTGSDNANFVALANWLSEWFPKIPFWFPQEGAGMSFTISYPILNHLIVVLVEKITSYPIAVAFRIWGLVTVALTSVGLYFLTFRLTKNQTVSALAAIFYPLCPITWIFLLEWGFAAEQLSYVFVAPVLVFLSLFLDELYLTGLTLKSKIYFLLFAVFFVFLPMAHPNVFAGVLMLVAILFIVYPLFNYKSKKVNFKRATFVGLISLITVFFLSSFWVLPLFRYHSIAVQGAPVAKEKPDYAGFMQTSVYPVNVFNITDKTAAYQSYDDPLQPLSPWLWRNVSFPLVISLLALVGLIGSLFINRKVFAFGFANLIPLAIAVFPQVSFHLMKFPYSGYFLNWRAAIVPSRFIIPLLAGFGCYVIAYLVTFPLDLISKKIRFALIKHSTRMIFIVFSAALTMLVAGVLLWQFKSWPDYPGFLLSYGPETVAPSRKLDLRNVWRKEFDECFGKGTLLDKEIFPECSNLTLKEHFWTDKLKIACTNLAKNNDDLPMEIVLLCGSNPSPEVVKKVVNECNKGILDSRYSEVCEARPDNFWNQIKPESWTAMIKSKELFNGGRHIFPKSREIFDDIRGDTNTRVDIGTSHGGLMMVEPFYSQVPELPVYYNQGTLIMKLWNYQISVFNQEESPWPQDSIMFELSKYFGLEYMLMEEDVVPTDRYEKAGWERLKRWQETSGWLALWKFKEPAGLLRATTKPLVLVIGQDKVDGYFRIFHLANLGVLPFEEALIVKGGPYPDAYSANELSNFDAVILEGYSYKNQSRGWKVLNEYVEGGGSLLINTGWQYSSADWQLDETPDFFPLNTLKWIDAGKTDDYLIENSEIAGAVDVEKFDPLIFSEVEAWKISSSDRSDLRDWAKPVISVNETPIIAGGNYGLGKVVWLGLDLPGHIGAYNDNEEEIKLYKNLLSYLLKDKEGRELNASFNRDYPDKLEIMINEPSSQKVAVYWSEAYYPDFKAKLVENGKKASLKVYKAGPGMTLFVLPSVSAGSKIIYEYKTPIFIIIARIISLTTFIALILAILRPQLLQHGDRAFSRERNGKSQKESHRKNFRK